MPSACEPQNLVKAFSVKFNFWKLVFWSAALPLSLSIQAILNFWTHSPNPVWTQENGLAALKRSAALLLAKPGVNIWVSNFENYKLQGERTFCTQWALFWIVCVFEGPFFVHCRFYRVEGRPLRRRLCTASVKRRIVKFLVMTTSVSYTWSVRCGSKVIS